MGVLEHFLIWFGVLSDRFFFWGGVDFLTFSDRLGEWLFSIFWHFLTFSDRGGVFNSMLLADGGGWVGKSCLSFADLINGQFLTKWWYKNQMCVIASIKNCIEYNYFFSNFPKSIFPQSNNYYLWFVCKIYNDIILFWKYWRTKN